jgi:exodeoxyribonuclease VII small subunit
MSKTNDVTKMNFETAISELEAIVNKFESGQVDLENSIDLYARGAQLKTHCEKKLSEAKLKVEKISITKDGKVSTTNFIEDQVSNA